MMTTRLLAALFAGSVMATAGAQTGADSCQAPDPLVGQGSFAFDSTLATTGTEGQAEPACYLFGTSVISSDIWFDWTADATGMVTIGTCASFFDTKIAAYPNGGCPTTGTALACNDDYCNLRSVISFAVSSGATYTLQVGTFGAGSNGGVGALDISIAPPTANDDCSSAATLVGQGSFPFDNRGASTGVEGQVETLCYSLGSSTIDKDLWYGWRADTSGIASISTCLSTIDTKLAIYAGSGCPIAGSALACDDDGCGSSSRVTLPVTAGASYTIQLGGPAGSVGGVGNLDIVIDPIATNDDCAASETIAGQGSFAFNQTGATAGAEGQGEALCYILGSSLIDNDVWYTWTADATGLAVVGTCSSSVDTKLAAYPSSGCPIAGSALACNDDLCALQSKLLFAVTSGTSYTLQVGTFPGAVGGTGSLDITIVPPQANDDCSSPSVISGQGSFAFSQVGAFTGSEGQSELLCYSFGSSAVESDVWYSWTADATGAAVIGTCTSSVDTKLAIYPGLGCPTVGSALACSDDACGLQAQVAVDVISGNTYMLQVGSSPGAASGAGSLDIVILPPLPADDCSTPEVIAGQGSFAYSTTLASTGIEGQGEALCYFFLGGTAIANDIWFSWTADVTGPATISTCNSVLDTKIAAYPGGGCPVSGTSLACNEDLCGLQSQITFDVVAGVSYMLQFGNFPGLAGGPGTFDISIVDQSEPGAGFCSCDAASSACNNRGAAGNGCSNSAGASGANLTGSGSAVIGADSLVLLASGLAPAQPGLFFQGDNAINAGAGIVFGNGLRCVGGNAVRLSVVFADGAGQSNTNGLAQAISVVGGVAPGDLKHYQLWYRDPLGSSCGATFNLTNGYSIQW